MGEQTRIDRCPCCDHAGPVCPTHNRMGRVPFAVAYPQAGKVETADEKIDRLTAELRQAREELREAYADPDGGAPAKLCEVCHHPVRFGPRHVQCGDLLMERDAAVKRAEAAEQLAKSRHEYLIRIANTADCHIENLDEIVAGLVTNDAELTTLRATVVDARSAVKALEMLIQGWPTIGWIFGQTKELLTRLDAALARPDAGKESKP